jgi:hypothetical protein
MDTSGYAFFVIEKKTMQNGMWNYEYILYFRQKNDLDKHMTLFFSAHTSQQYRSNSKDINIYKLPDKIDM